MAPQPLYAFRRNPGAANSSSLGLPVGSCRDTSTGDLPTQLIDARMKRPYLPRWQDGADAYLGWCEVEMWFCELLWDSIVTHHHGSDRMGTSPHRLCLVSRRARCWILWVVLNRALAENADSISVDAVPDCAMGVSLHTVAVCERLRHFETCTTLEDAAMKNPLPYLLRAILVGHLPCCPVRMQTFYALPCLIERRHIPTQSGYTHAQQAGSRQLRPPSW